MSRGFTIAEFVQQVLYLMYRVRLDVDTSKEDAWHSKTDKFKEIVMEGNFAIQELQKEQDWNFLRDRWEMGISHNPPQGIQEFRLPPDVYKVCTGYNDAVRLHKHHHPEAYRELQWEEVRSGSHTHLLMHDQFGNLNQPDFENRAFFVGDTISFKRRWTSRELGCLLETDVIRYIEPMHICTDECEDNCPKAYKERLFTWLPDPYYLIVRTAARRAIADPSCSEVLQSLTDEASKFLSAMRENDSAHTTIDYYETTQLGFIPVL